MARVLLIVLDSVGVGGAPDAADYGDAGANTVGHIASACAGGRGDRPGVRQGQLTVPNLVAAGLGEALRCATGAAAPGLEGRATLGVGGSAIETSRGKDTPSGHWEIAGVPVTFDWGYFPQTVPAFPADLIEAFVRETGVPGILGNKHASGTDILDEFGAAHIQTGKPILYTSVDSVLQIAAHEAHFGRDRLYQLCEVMRRLTRPLNIGRVIARPFIGDVSGSFVRTPYRRDWALTPPAPTLLDRLVAAGREVVTVGKIGDIFAHKSTGREIKGPGNMANLDLAIAAFATLGQGGFIFANLVDFDSEFGHRRDVPGYAAALEAFDARLPEVVAGLGPGDLCIITADHGNDPTWHGTDHTREQVPLLLIGSGLPPGNLGVRSSFADIAQSVLRHLGLPQGPVGRPFL